MNSDPLKFGNMWVEIRQRLSGNNAKMQNCSPNRNLNFREASPALRIPVTTYREHTHMIRRHRYLPIWTIFHRPDVIKSLGREHAVIIMNHHYELDWLYGWMVADRFRVLGNCRVYVKKMLKYVPLIGWAWNFSDVVFLERNWEKVVQFFLDPIFQCKNVHQHQDWYFFVLERKLWGHKALADCTCESLCHSWFLEGFFSQFFLSF